VQGNLTVSGHAHVRGALVAFSTNEVVPFLVLAAGATSRHAEVATACVPLAAQELLLEAIVANCGLGFPARTLRVVGHWVVQALRVAALAAWCLAGVATALVVPAAGEVATRTRAASATGRHTDVTTAVAACTTLEAVTIPVEALFGACWQRFSSAKCADGHWVSGLRIRFVAALAARSSAYVATALASRSTRERIPIHIEAAEIALGLARVATALTSAAREEVPMRVEACGHAETVEELGDVKTLRGLESQEGGLFALCLVLAHPVHTGVCLRRTHRHQKGSCCNLLQGHVDEKCVMIRENQRFASR